MEEMLRNLNRENEENEIIEERKAIEN